MGFSRTGVTAFIELIDLGLWYKTSSMPDKDEKARRKQLLHSQRDEQRRSIREGLPVPAAMMKALFTYVDEHLSSSECDDTLRHASEFIRANDLPAETVIAWLEDKGGYCDCEVFNAEEALEDAVPGYRDLPPPDGVRG